MSTTGNLENKPLTLSEMRDFIGDISAHARGGNTLKATKTGAMVSVDDAYAGRLLKLTAYGNSVQDGTPTPESPVEIKSVARIGATIAERNILPTKAAETATSNGITFTRNANGTITISGTATADAYFTVCSSTYDFVVIQPNMDLQSGLIGNMDEHISIQHRKNGSGGANVIANASTTPTTTTTTTSNYPAKLHSRILVASGATVNATVYPYLVLGSETFTDNPAYSSTTPLTLVDSEGVAHELRSLPDGTKDELVINADGSGTLTENIKHCVYDTADGGWVDGSVTGQIRHARGDMESYIAWVTSKRSNGVPTVVGGSGVISSTVDQLVVANSGKTAAEFVSAMNGTPLVIDYVAKAPRTYHIPAINMPSLPDLVSNAWISATDADGVPIACECGIEYRRDINKVIGDIEEAIADIVSQ